ncbi:MAG: glycosyltransferase [Planctomycetota bacterium]|jgi:glycosyltransferase involved in cell wall biosynthesis|nr:glycosyltransferase [Planctomycetota bacterium]
MPDVSVLLPVFNGEKTIRRAVDSILGQSLAALEIIVVDDGSNDATLKILHQLQDPRVRVTSTLHQGVADAANHGLNYCSSKYIARMDADDVAHPEKLEKQLDYLKQNQLDVVGCQVRILDEAGKGVESMLGYQQWINRETLDPESIRGLRFVELPMVNPTILADRSYFELGFTNSEFPEDYDLFLRALEQGFRFGKVSQVLFDWYDLPDRLTRNHPRYTETAFDHCRKHFLLRGPLNSVREIDFWGVGKTGKPWLRWLKHKEIKIRRCFDIDTKKVGHNIHGGFVEHCENLKRPDGTKLFIAVGKRNARCLIADFLLKKGFRIGEDAWFIA